MKRKLYLALTLAVLMATMVTSLALADQVVNKIDSSIDNALETTTITAGSSATVGFILYEAQGQDPTPTGDRNGCNAAGNAPTVIAFNVPAGVTVFPNSLSFTNCNVVQDATFSSSAPATYTITVSATGGKSGSLYDTAPASFTLVVNAAPPSDTTAPDITPVVSGILGNHDWYTSDVDVSWLVSDDQSAVSSTTGCDPSSVTSDTAGVTFTCTATSVGGTASKSVTVKRDASKPSVSASANPGPNNYGWNNSDVTVSYTCTDIGSSGVDATTSDLGNDILSASGTASGTCVDMAGNSASVDYTAQIDKVGPTATANASPAANVNGWNNTSVTVTFSGYDGLGSGIASCDAPVILSNEGVSQSASGYCYDKAGNQSNKAEVTGINIDMTPPLNVVVGPDRPADKNGYYNHGFTATWSGEDALSQIDSCTVSNYSGPDTDTGSMNGTCIDKAGNTSDAVAFMFKYDGTAPTLVFASQSPEANANGWNNTDVSFSFTTADNLSGVDTTTPNSPLVLTVEGLSVTGQVVVIDKAGNSVTFTSLAVKIDKTAPVITDNGPTTGPNGSNGWYINAVTNQFSSDGAISGLADSSKANFMVSSGTAEGSDVKVFSGSVSDNASNINLGIDSAAFKIDLSNPTVTCPSPAPTFLLNQLGAQVTASISDLVSGPASLTASTAANTSAVGTKTVSITGYDNAGRFTTVSCSYNVHYNWSGFLQPINDTAHFVGLQTSIFKGGSTVPVKFQLFDANGNPVQAATAPIWLTPVKGSAMNAPVDEGIYTDSATSGNTYRWDAIAQQYIYNWSTKGVSTGFYYRIGVKLDDGQTIYVNIGLR